MRHLPAYALYRGLPSTLWSTLSVAAQWHSSAPAAADAASVDVEAVVIGAGVVGLAIARELALAGREVLLLEAAGSIGTGISSRNSEVVHAGGCGTAGRGLWRAPPFPLLSHLTSCFHSLAGLYYPPGSLKAQLCVAGRRLLYRFCEQHGVPHRRTGKLVVAAASGEPQQQLAALAALHAQALASGVDDVQLLGADEARELEPAVRCRAALLSPSTGIVDSHRCDGGGMRSAYRMFLLSFRGGGRRRLRSPVALHHSSLS